MAIGWRRDYNDGMSNPSTVSQAAPETQTRSKFLPIAIASVAVVVGIGAWVVAAPGEKVAGPPQVGKPAPDLKLASTSGGTWDLRDHRGREVLIVFFRTHT